MKTNATKQNPQGDEHPSAVSPELKVLRPDGSWKPIDACVAMPEQFEGTLTPEVLERIIALARDSNLALERVINGIRQHWSN